MSAFDVTVYRTHVGASLAAARTYLARLPDAFRPASALELGCGAGPWLRACMDRGVHDVLGIDGDQVPRDQLMIPEDRFRAADPAAGLPALERRFDLAIAVDAAARLPRDRMAALVEYLTGAADVVLFSSGVGQQDGGPAIELAWPGAWAELFDKRGWHLVDPFRAALWHDATIPWWYRQNVVLYVKAERLAELGFAGLASAMPLDAVHPEMLLAVEARLQRATPAAAALQVGRLRSLQQGELSELPAAAPCPDAEEIAAAVGGAAYPYATAFAERRAATDTAVSVVTRTKDRPLLLARAIASVVGQGFAKWHLFIVNDGGDPQPVDALVADFKAALGDRITVIHNPVSGGMEAASNLAVSRVTSPYLIIHDDDDSWHPDFLAETVAFLDNPANARFAGVVTQATVVHERINGSVIERTREEPFNPGMAGIDLGALLGVNQFPPITFLIRRSALEAVGAYNPNLPVLGDWDFNIRLMLAADVGFIPRALAYYHHREPTTGGAYGNTVNNTVNQLGVDRHKTFNVLYRNALLRQSLRQAPWATGMTVAQLHHLTELQATLKRIEWQLGQQGWTIHQTHVLASRVDDELNQLCRLGRVFLPLRRTLAFVRGRISFREWMGRS